MTKKTIKILAWVLVSLLALFIIIQSVEWLLTIINGYKMGLFCALLINLSVNINDVRKVMKRPFGDIMIYILAQVVYYGVMSYLIIKA